MDGTRAETSHVVGYLMQGPISNEFLAVTANWQNIARPNVE